MLVVDYRDFCFQAIPDIARRDHRAHRERMTQSVLDGRAFAATHGLATGSLLKQPTRQNRGAEGSGDLSADERNYSSRCDAGEGVR
jgi:hypothetical protein